MRNLDVADRTSILAFREISVLIIMLYIQLFIQKNLEHDPCHMCSILCNAQHGQKKYALDHAILINKFTNQLTTSSFCEC